MAKINAGLACPTCDQGGISSELYTLPPNPFLRCDRGHQWNDINTLKTLNPRKLDLIPPPEKFQPGHVSFTINMSASTADALKARFGDRLAADLRVVLEAVAGPRMVILSTEELSRLEDRLGPGLTSGAELFGRIFALKEELKQLRNDHETLLRKTGSRREGAAEIEVELGEWLPKAMAMAGEARQDLREFLSAYLRNSLENDWITVSS